MSKSKIEQPINSMNPELPDEVVAYTVCKSSYLGTLGYEIKIVDGQVVSCTPVQDAEDVMQIVAGKISQKLWDSLAKQKSKHYRS